MSCQHCIDFEEIFDEDNAQLERKAYLRDGPRRTTEVLLKQLRSKGLSGSTVLDIGGGVGIIPFELLNAGAERAVIIEASQAATRVSAALAEEQSLEERVEIFHGDFLDLWCQVQPAEIVTLDRVICCYPDGEGLVSRSARRAKRWYGIVIPRRVWWTRLGVWFLNASFWLRRLAFRTYLHDPKMIAETLAQENFALDFEVDSGFWRIALFERRGVRAAA